MPAAPTRTLIARASRNLLDPRTWIRFVLFVNFVGYDTGEARWVRRLGPVRMAPNVSIRNGRRVEIGAGSEIGQGCHLWAGDTQARIILGAHTLLAPGVFITVTNYGFDEGEGPVMDLPRRERDVVIGDDCWLGTNVVVVAGVTIGRGCVVGAGSVVTRDLPPGSVAAGIPARVIRPRGEPTTRETAIVDISDAAPGDDVREGTGAVDCTRVGNRGASARASTGM